MSAYSNRAILTLCLSFTLLMLSTTNHAFLSHEVSQAMDNANACNQAQQSYVYSQCMQENNEQIKKNLLSKSQQQIQNFSSSKKRKVQQNIENKVKSNTKHCKIEKEKYGDSMTGERRYPYCLYENMLELLINVERNIDIYSR